MKMMRKFSGMERLRYVFKKHEQLVKAFLVGFIFRMTAEIIVGKYPIGYDTSTYYILSCVKMDWLRELAKYPLYQYILFCVYVLVGNAILAVKILAPLICGLFTFSLAIWGLSQGIKKEDIVKFVIAT